MSLEFELGREADTATVRMTGRIDRDAGGALDEAFATATATPADALELNFDDVDYINSTGIALIVGLLARARSQRIPVRAVGLTAHYRHIFEITRLSDFIEIVQPVQS